MMRRTMLVPVALLPLSLWIAVAPARAQDAAAKDPSHEQRKPKVFAIIFNMGYGGDAMPQDKEGFEKMVLACKEANYNVLLCKYDDWREEICRKHGMLMFVNLLDGAHHVYRSPEVTKALCEKLRGNDTIYGYHLWSDQVGKSLPGRNRDIANVHEWDPTHPNYVGTYRLGGNDGLVNPDLHGYYDFHWRRGGLWGHLNGAWGISKAKACSFLIYMQSDPGMVGKGNYNRLAYSNSVSIAYGLKGMMYHYRGGTYAGNGQWDELGKDLGKANGDVLPVGPELMKIGTPIDVYSTPISIDAKNRYPVDPPAVPGGFKAVPEDYWAKFESGEFVVGVFKDKDQRDAAVLANHNAYIAQSVKLRPKDGKTVELFDRESKSWQALTPADGVVQFEIGPGSFQLVHAK
jgi:hypothetical protein